MPGFPIRTPSDLSSVDSSPRLIAASYVLHRLLMPRHPPCALKNLATKMLASTMQFTNNKQTPAQPPPNTQPHQAPPPKQAADTQQRSDRYDEEPAPQENANHHQQT